MPSYGYSAKAVDYEIEIDDANTQYALELPEEVKAIEFQARGAVAILHSFEEGAVDGSSPPGPYQTLKSGGVYKKDHLYISGHRTLYVACASGSQVVEVRCWI